jgi:hypothetical protein
MCDCEVKIHVKTNSDAAIPEGAQYGVYDTENGAWVGVWFFSREEAEAATIPVEDDEAWDAANPNLEIISVATDARGGAAWLGVARSEHAHPPNMKFSELPVGAVFVVNRQRYRKVEPFSYRRGIYNARNVRTNAPARFGGPFPIRNLIKEIE